LEAIFGCWSFWITITGIAKIIKVAAVGAVCVKACSGCIVAIVGGAAIIIVTCGSDIIDVLTSRRVAKVKCAGIAISTVDLWILASERSIAKLIGTWIGIEAIGINFTLINTRWKLTENAMETSASTVAVSVRKTCTKSATS